MEKQGPTGRKQSQQSSANYSSYQTRGARPQNKPGIDGQWLHDKFEESEQQDSQRRVRKGGGVGGQNAPANGSFHSNQTTANSGSGGGVNGANNKSTKYTASNQDYANSYDNNYSQRDTVSSARNGNNNNFSYNNNSGTASNGNSGANQKQRQDKGAQSKAYYQSDERHNGSSQPYSNGNGKGNNNYRNNNKVRNQTNYSNSSGVSNGTEGGKGYNSKQGKRQQGQGYTSQQHQQQQQQYGHYQQSAQNLSPQQQFYSDDENEESDDYSYGGSSADGGSTYHRNTRNQAPQSQQQHHQQQQTQPPVTQQTTSSVTQQIQLLLPGCEQPFLIEFTQEQLREDTLENLLTGVLSNINLKEELKLLIQINIMHQIREYLPPENQRKSQEFFNKLLERYREAKPRIQQYEQSLELQEQVHREALYQQHFINAHFLQGQHHHQHGALQPAQHNAVHLSSSHRRKTSDDAQDFSNQNK